MAGSTGIADRTAIIARVDALQQALAALPPAPPIEKALYHCDRLRIAVRTSHSEGTRFAAFTLGKIVRDLGTQVPATVPVLMEEIRGALVAAGLELNK